MQTLLHDQNCTRCPALVASRRRIVHGYGNPASGIVFIGEAPGRHGADRTGIPFCGDRSGRALRRMLVRLGLADTDAATTTLRCFITNAVRCCPPGNRTPTALETRTCASWLEAELDHIRPRLLVPVGRVALQSIGKRYLGRDPGPIRALHATTLHAGNVTIVPLIHPARISCAATEAFVATMRALMSG